MGERRSGSRRQRDKELEAMAEQALAIAQEARAGGNETREMLREHMQTCERNGTETLEHAKRLPILEAQVSWLTTAVVGAGIAVFGGLCTMAWFLFQMVLELKGIS